MTSAIDPTKPTAVVATTQSVRDNFLAAKSEIEALQTAVGTAQSDITALQGDVAAKQAALVSGTSIKTINGTSLLGAGDIVITGGSGSASLPPGGFAGDSLIWDGTAWVSGRTTVNLLSASTANTQASSIRSGSVLEGFFSTSSFSVLGSHLAGQYLQVDFQVPVAILKASYANSQGSSWAPPQVELHGSADGITWVVAKTHTDDGSTTTQQVLGLPTTQSFRYWRLYQAANTRGGSAGYEWHLRALVLEGVTQVAVVTQTGGTSVVASDTPPTTPSAGDLWVDTTDMSLNIWYDDGTSAQWVEVSGPASGQQIAVGTVAPSSPALNQLWLDTN